MFILFYFSRSRLSEQLRFATRKRVKTHFPVKNEEEGLGVTL